MEISPYAVGALLYAPANQQNLARRIIEGQIEGPYSLALCLEDSISDMAVDQAEIQMLTTLSTIAHTQSLPYCPLIFIRVRTPEQIVSLYQRMDEQTRKIITGFIAPKFTADCARAYLEALTQVRTQSARTLYLMPILESADLTEPDLRLTRLRAIKQIIDEHADVILNIRVGGNDLCGTFGLRRRYDQTIYDIGCIANVLFDILACFARDYVVSGPVWEYFNDLEGNWAQGLAREMQLDLLNGFVGKTVIHPNQISVVNQMLQVSAEDAADARRILAMADNRDVLVEGSATASRMNEYKTHVRWARRIRARAEIYGVQA